MRYGESLPDAITAIRKSHHLERLELQPLSLAERSGAFPFGTTALAIHPGQRALPSHLIESEVHAGRIARRAKCVAVGRATRTFADAHIISDLLEKATRAAVAVRICR